MPSTRESNTMAEGLQRVLNELVKMKTMPDTDLAFIVDLETEIVDYLRSPTSGQQESGEYAPQDSLAGGMGGGPPMMPMAPPGTPAGGGISAPMIPGDELTRMLGSGPR